MKSVWIFRASEYVVRGFLCMALGWLFWLGEWESWVTWTIWSVSMGSMYFARKKRDQMLRAASYTMFFLLLLFVWGRRVPIQEIPDIWFVFLTDPSDPLDQQIFIWFIGVFIPILIGWLVYIFKIRTFFLSGAQIGFLFSIAFSLVSGDVQGFFSLQPIDYGLHGIFFMGTLYLAVGEYRRWQLQTYQKQKRGAFRPKVHGKIGQWEKTIKRLQTERGRLKWPDMNEIRTQPWLIHHFVPVFFLFHYVPSELKGVDEVVQKLYTIGLVDKETAMKFLSASEEERVALLKNIRLPHELAENLQLTTEDVMSWAFSQQAREQELDRLVSEYVGQEDDAWKEGPFQGVSQLDVPIVPTLESGDMPFGDENSVDSSIDFFFF